LYLSAANLSSSSTSKTDYLLIESFKFRMTAVVIAKFHAKLLGKMPFLGLKFETQSSSRTSHAAITNRCGR
jgi:hypothetical protein